VEWQQFGRWEIVSAEGVESGDFGGYDTWVAKDTDAQHLFHKAMIDWLEDAKKVPGTNLKQSLQEWGVVLAAYQSALEHRPIDLAGFNPPDDLVDRYRAAVRA
jgi:hypothetical protein